MSEPRQTEGMHQHSETQQTTELVVDDSGAQPTYTNFCRVMATPEEMILDFGLNPQPFTAGRQDVKANHRIVLNYYTAKRFLAVIGTTIQRHEQAFGTIEVDVNRRVSPQRPASMPAVAQGTTGPFEIIGLN